MVTHCLTPFAPRRTLGPYEVSVFVGALQSRQACLGWVNYALATLAEWNLFAVKPQRERSEWARPVGRAVTKFLSGFPRPEGLFSGKSLVVKHFFYL